MHWLLPLVVTALLIHSMFQIAENNEKLSFWMHIYIYGSVAFIVFAPTMWFDDLLVRFDVSDASRTYADFFVAVAILVVFIFKIGQVKTANKKQNDIDF